MTDVFSSESKHFLELGQSTAGLSPSKRIFREWVRKGTPKKNFSRNSGTEDLKLVQFFPCIVDLAIFKLPLTLLLLFFWEGYGRKKITWLLFSFLSTTRRFKLLLITFFFFEIVLKNFWSSKSRLCFGHLYYDYVSWDKQNNTFFSFRHPSIWT